MAPGATEAFSAPGHGSGHGLCSFMLPSGTGGDSTMACPAALQRCCWARLETRTEPPVPAAPGAAVTVPVTAGAEGMYPAGQHGHSSGTLPCLPSLGHGGDALVLQGQTPFPSARLPALSIAPGGPEQCSTGTLQQSQHHWELGK